VLKKKDFYVNKHQIALHIRFLPKQATEENIYSPQFLRRAEFINIDQSCRRNPKAPRTAPH
jgi:hypothetical protein